MPSVKMDRVPENGSEYNAKESGDEQPSTTLFQKKKIRKRGIIYIPTIPPYMNVAKIREIFSEYGDIGRIYLQPNGSELEVMFFQS